MLLNPRFSFLLEKSKHIWVKLKNRLGSHALVGQQVKEKEKEWSKSENCCTEESVENWCSILVLSAHLGSVAGSTKTLANINNPHIFNWTIGLSCVRIGKRFHYIYIINLIIMSCRQHEYPCPSFATYPYLSLPLAGLKDYIQYPHRAAVCMFELAVLLLLGHMWGSIGVHPLWARPCFSSRVLHVWFVLLG